MIVKGARRGGGEAGLKKKKQLERRESLCFEGENEAGDLMH